MVRIRIDAKVHYRTSFAKSQKAKVEAWKSVIESGNRCYSEMRYADAANEFTTARFQAECLMAIWPEPGEAVAALLVSYHNLAEAYCRLDQPERAEKELRTVYDSLLIELASSRMPEGRDKVLQKAVGQAYRKLICHINRCGNCLSEPLPVPPSAELRELYSYHYRSH